MAVGENEPEATPGNQTYTARWFLKRMLIGMAILVLSFGSLAWLTHAARDPGLVETESIIEMIGRSTANF